MDINRPKTPDWGFKDKEMTILGLLCSVDQRIKAERRGEKTAERGPGEKRVRSQLAVPGIKGPFTAVLKGDQVTIPASV